MKKRKYRQSYNFYDSLQLGDPIIKDPDALLARKDILSRLANNIEIIERQDSLQRIAAMPEDERKSYIKKLVRQLRKQQGLKDEGAETTLKKFQSSEETSPPLFADNNKKGDWYFYNKNSRQKGLADFTSKWGKRVNTDDWRRSDVFSSGGGRSRSDQQPDLIKGTTQATAGEEVEITFESLFDNIPLTPETLQQSNDSIQNALFGLGMIYIQQLEDCSSGTETMEDLRKRFPEFIKMDEVLFNLYYCYNKHGETGLANEVKKSMGQQFADSKLTTIVITGKSQDAENKEQEASATRTYEKIYDLFLEGNFSEAIAQKKLADSTYGSNHWTPQLLYIEAVYYIKQREDSIAAVVLNNITMKFERTPIANKARTLLNVLNRREQIENELRNMVINTPEPDTTTRYRQVAIIQSPVKDSVRVIPLPVVVKAKPVTDSLSKQPPVNPVSASPSFGFDSEAPHYVIILLTKVDPIFVNEAKNAFSRYNRDTYYNKQMQAELIEIDTDNRVLLISPFKNAADALTYIDQTSPKTASEIIPWLKGGKYSYSIITEKNLEILKNNKDIDKYKQFLDKNIPGKF